MPDLKKAPDLKKELAVSIEKALDGMLSSQEIFSLVEIPPLPSMGDYAFPCFRLSKLLKKAPDEIAAELSLKINLPSGIEKAVQNGPYLNFFAAKQGIAKHAIDTALAQKEGFGKNSIGKGQRIMVEYSSPNANKPLHLGHLRNNSIGMAIANIAAANGFNAIKANLVNDRGIHICKSMLAYKLFGHNSTPEKEHKKPDHFVGDYYILYSQKAGEDPELEKQAYKMLVLWENGDKATIALWRKITGWAISGFKETYKAFGSRFDEWFFESHFYNKAGELLEQGKAKGLFKLNEEGALVAILEPHGLPNKTVLRADGTSIYITNDLALTKHKFEKFRLNECLWVVGSEQDLYLKQLFKIFELLGFAWAKNCRHLSHGMVNLPEGKMKSREGKVVDADDLIEEMKQLAGGEINKRNKKISGKDLEKRSLAIALAAIKFHLLKVAAQKDLLFNPAESISFEGETGPYVQYAYARAKSILAKAKSYKKPKDFSLLSSIEEQNLAKTIGSFPDAVKKSLEQLSPHIICQYLIQLAEEFNTFYHKHQVMQAESGEAKSQRLALVEATAIVLKNGLALLDIETMEKM